MKTTNINNIGAQSCSCTSCTYKSEADRPSLRRIISQGTRIDRLYFGKYIPLREKKLLEKLVRTRGVYDDIRAQLISNSTISLEAKAVLKPPVKVSPKKFKNRQYSNEILKLVDLVDKGEKLESKELSVCCSCCTCSSKYDDHYKHIDKQRLKRNYHGGHRHRYIKDKIGDYRKRAVRFKTKHIKSDPCTCTFKFSGMLKHLSKGTPKIMDYNPVPFTDFNSTFDDEINQRLQKNSYLSFISNENLRTSKTHLKEMMLEGIRKISETKLKIGEKLDLHEKKSLEKINKLKNNIKSKLKDHKVQKKNSGVICECPENNLLLHIKKDSISKFKDDLKRKRILKNWECYPECVEDICIPEECFVKLKQKRSRCKNNECNLIVPQLIKPTIKVQSKQEDATMLNKKNKQNLRLRAQQTLVKANPWRRFINEKETIPKIANDNFKKEDLKKNALMPGIAITNKTKAKNLNIGPPRENTSRQKVVRIGSSFNFNIEFYKNKGETQSKQTLIKYDHRHKKRRKIPKYEHRRQQGSQIKYTMTNTKTGEDNSKSCSSFCPRKLKPKKRKPKSIISTNKTTTTKESMLTFNIANDNVERNAYYTHQEIIKLQKNGQKRFHKKQILLPYECEPNVCIPDICDPYKCIKLINTRNTKRKEQSVQYDTVANLSQTGRPKSISSSTSTPHPSLKTKFVNSKTMYKSKRNKLNKIINRKINMNQSSDSKTDRQVVRIGSNISFNLEFYKTKQPYHISSPNLKILSNGINVKSNKKSGNQKVLGDKSTTPINNNLYKKAGIGSTLKRCFCTLKLQEKKKIKRKKMVTIGTNFISDLYTNAIVTYNKSTKTKKGNLPLNYFECEPFVCIPGSCDPYECLDRINRKRLKEVGSITEPSEKTSVSSSTYLKKSLRAIQIQSKPQSKDRKTSAKTKTNISEIKEYLPRGSSNQAVKIGSSFSFDVEFFKTNIPIKKISSKPHIEQKTKLRTKIKKIGKTGKNSKFNVANVTTQSQQKDKLNKSTMPGHLIKRCFCTLNLQKNSKNQNGKQKILTTSMIPREYTINRATTTLNPILICQKNLSDCSKHSGKKINSIIGSRPIHIQSTQCQESLMVVEKQSQCYSLSHIGDDKWESSLSFIEERQVSINQKKITNLSQYIKQNFCTMNLQLINKNVYEKNPNTSISTGNGRVKEFLKGNKSSVRLGSNFSFDISFSKHQPSSKYSSNAELYRPIKDNSKKVKTIGTIRNYNTNFDRQSQSTFNKVIHKGSAAMPIAKRCFCTLKLHKKGRTPMKNNKKQVNIKYVSKTPNNTISRGQNTDFKPMKIAHSLKPYECEPNICIPGHCDPYKCLEIMKRRKKGNALLPYECEPNICIPGQCDPYQCLEIIKRRNKITKESGIVTVQSKKSASSITTDNHSKGTQKSHQLKMKTKENSAKLSPNTFRSESDVVQPSRQVVRIGSNFSFNIEFFKDQGSPPAIQKTTKDFKEIKQRNQRKINITEKGISTPTESKLRRHKVTEIEKSPNRIASTMTSSFLKRCFCTAQLRKNSKAAFLKKCFCLIKSKKPSAGNNEGIHISKVQHVDKKINTKNLKPKRYQLAPYECEPGICIPGQCNPYECDKIMRKRTKSKLSSTAEFKDSRSVSIDSQKLATKNAKIQFKNREKFKAIKTRDRSRSSLIHSDRQVVRIGSNFSFNIEFYKNKPSRYLMNLPSNQQKDVIRKRLKNQQSELIATHTKRSQADPINKMNRSTEQKHFLKRCFCTLQLHNQNSNIPKEKNERKKSNKDIKIRNKSVMTKEPKRPEINLQDYECPPGICIPNQCDPYECERIIKMRRMQQYKEFGMSTKSPKKSNVGSTTRSLKKYKQTTQTIGNKKYHKNTNYKSKEVSSTQRVKIGSSFNFNIEFYKNKNNHGLEINKQPKPTRKYQSKGKVSNAKTQMQKQVKFAKIGDKKTKSQSTMMNVSPTLKRCFCTLFMKSAKEKRKVKKQTTSSVGTETQKPFVPPTSTLLPYECEPQTCIPGECDPVKCLERIMKRNKNFGGNTNFSQTKSSAGTMTPGKAKFKTQKSQFKALSKGEFPTKNKRKKGQVVRIGSNFNFNIEFYKDNNAPNETNDYDRNAKFIRNHTQVHSGITKKDYKQNQSKKSFHTAESQLQKKACDVSTCPQLKTMLKEKQTNVKNNKSPTFLKRCFCALKLQKLRNRPKNAATSFEREIKKQEQPPPPKSNIAIEQKLLPYECEPNVCIPGQCDPYECEKRIKARELCIRNKCDKKCYMTQTSQNICTQIKNPCSNKCIGIRPDEYKIRKQQSSLTRSVTTKRTVNEPRYVTNLNNQAVKVGSNFSFNIEFYKKGTPVKTPIALGRNERKSTFEDVRDKNIITKSAYRRNYGSQAMAISSQDKTLGVQNELNRCFCTLKLQKNRQSKYGKKNLNFSPPYPQTVEVRRLSFQPNTKITKYKHTPVKSVSTRINEKYLKKNQNFCPCRNVTNTTEMETILPFAPNKFKDTTSKTFIPVQNENKRDGRSDTKQGLKLNKKKSKRHLNHNKKLLKDHERSTPSRVRSVSNFKEFLCRCAGVFSRKEKTNNVMNTKNYSRNNRENENNTYINEPKPSCEYKCLDNLRSSKSDRRPVGQIVNQNTKIRKSKSLKLDNQKGNNGKKNIKENNNVNKNTKYANGPDADNTGINVSIKQNKYNDGVLCSHCKMIIEKNKTSPPKVHFDDKPLKIDSLDETKGIKKSLKSVIKKQKKDVNLNEHDKCASCDSCGKRFNKEELLKAAGDRLIDIEKKINPHKIKDLFNKHIRHKDNKNASEQKELSPLFEMQLNRRDYDIINKDEVIDNVTKLSKISVKDKPKLTKPHDKSCSCCICRPKKMKINLKKPCTCGSFICSKKSAKMRKDSLKRKYTRPRKPCVCGSPICDRETEAMRDLSSRRGKVTCICQKEREKKERESEKQRAIIRKQYHEEDRIRRKYRRKQDRDMEKRINKDSSDVILAAESIIDIGKLGITACADILRSIARITSDPKQAYFTLKSMKEDPELIMSTMQSAFADSGVAATARRVRLRCLSMRGVKQIKNFLEQYAITNFLLHIADKDPKRRMLKKTSSRVRERLDFGCSLYMGSLRKRPYLSIYDRWPWFYPHFLALLNVYRQFRDILLFLLAVVVWSPCIFCMEACRAIMCCFFCTG